MSRELPSRLMFHFSVLNLLLIKITSSIGTIGFANKTQKFIWKTYKNSKLFKSIIAAIQEKKGRISFRLI